MKSGDHTGIVRRMIHNPWHRIWVDSIRLRVAASALVLMVMGMVVGEPVVCAAPAEADWKAHGRILELDLASDSAWKISLDDGPWRAIKVPGGGWNSESQSPRIQVLRDVKDHVTYERKITIPKEALGQVVQLHFGGVNYGAELMLDDRKVGEHHGSQVPFFVDLTTAAKPGMEQTLRIKAYHRRYYLRAGVKGADIPVGWDFPEGGDGPSLEEAKAWNSEYHGQSKFAYGITRSIKLVVLPEVRVEGVFVRPSITSNQISFEFTIHNSSTRARSICVRGALKSWNSNGWNYPVIPEVQLSIPAGGVVEAKIGPVAWGLGPESYWWPNIPFREDYRAQLHYLDLKLMEGDAVVQTVRERFGFVEHAEGPFYYTVNGVRVFGIGDGTAESNMSYYDSYAEAPAFKTAHGCRETWRRYLRVGFNSNRLHCSVPTDLMMDTADEMGFMLIPEAPIWTDGPCHYDGTNTANTIREMIYHARRHPCVSRYSLANEILPTLQTNTPWRGLVDAAMEVDTSRPYIVEAGIYLRGANRLEGWHGGHAYITEHYTRIERPWRYAGSLRGMGEDCWAKDRMSEFPLHLLRARVADLACLSPWTWNNYWPNFLEGMNEKTWADRLDCGPDRVTGVNGWDSPILKFVQRSLDPYVVINLDLLRLNLKPAHKFGEGTIEWPYLLPRYASGGAVKQRIEVFNGGLTGNRMELRWSARWDNPDGPVAIAGESVPLTIEPGFHTNVPVCFTAPAIDAAERRICLVLESAKGGNIVFREDRSAVIITRSPEAGGAAVFEMLDKDTQGNWPSFYGADGYWIPGYATNQPGYAELAWKNSKMALRDLYLGQKRLLAVYHDPPSELDAVAACVLGNPIRFTVNVKDPARVAVYMADTAWPKTRKQRAEQAITVRDPAGRVLARTKVSDLVLGCYTTWKITGQVEFEVSNPTGEDAEVSGIFFDPP